VTTTRKQQPESASAASLTTSRPAGRADHGPYIPGGIAARPERPITDYLWSADPPKRQPGKEAEAG
jgi:hypothetical protein